jgi:AsmA protein
VPLTRRHARIPAAIALVALAAFAVLWIGARTTLARGMVAGWIADAAGLPSSIESLGLGFFPSPSVDIRGLAIAQPPGFGEEPFATVGRLRIRIPWSGIFDATDVHEIAATDATVRLVVNPDGDANWSQLGGKPDDGAAAPSAAEPVRWSIRTVRLERGAIDYRDLAAGSHGQLTGIALEADGLGPGQAFPFDLTLGGISGANTSHFAIKGQGRIDTAAGRYEGTALDYRGWVGGEPLPLAGAELTGSLGRASYEGTREVIAFEDGRFKFAEVPGTFGGSVNTGEPSMAARFAVSTEPFAPRKTAIILGKPLPATTDPAAFESLQLALVVSLQDDVLRLDPVSGRLDDTNFEARVVPAERLVRAGLDRIDLNRYLPVASATPAPRKKATLEALVAELAKMDIDAEIRMEEARVAGAILRDAVIRVERGEAPTS